MHAKVALRFYEELNDYLPPGQRKVCFDHACPAGAPVRTVLAAVGVPETKVDLILVNGESAGLDHRLRPGDRVSVYPVFESFDISALVRLEGRPLRQLRFVVDTRLGKLPAYLRLLGFDTLFEKDCPDARLAAISREQGRILLTREPCLVHHGGVTRGYCVTATVPRAQVVEVLARFDLAGAVQPFRRCLRCNTRLGSTGNADVLPPASAGAPLPDGRPVVCPGCGRRCWGDARSLRMLNLVERIVQTARARAAPRD